MHKALGSNPVQKKKERKNKTKNYNQVSTTETSIPNLAEGTAIHSWSQPTVHVIHSVDQFRFLKGALQHPVRIKVADVIPSEQHPGARIVRPELRRLVQIV